MHALAFVAAIALIAPHANPKLPLPVEAYVITGKTAAALLPPPLRATLEPAMSDPAAYLRLARNDPRVSPTSSGGDLARALRTAFAEDDLRAAAQRAALTIALSIENALPPDKLAAVPSHEPGTKDVFRRPTTLDMLALAIRQNSERLAFETRVFPLRLRSHAGVDGFGLRVYPHGAPAVDRLHELRAAAERRLQTLSVGSKEVRERERLGYFVRLALPVIETQMESAALLAARLITSAWEAADRPAFSGAPIGIPVKADGKNDGSTEYVCSRNSKVFHRADCPHAARIKKSNLVRFKSLREVLDTGRKPCKTCKPPGE